MIHSALELIEEIACEWGMCPDSSGKVLAEILTDIYVIAHGARGCGGRGGSDCPVEANGQRKINGWTRHRHELRYAREKHVEGHAALGADWAINELEGLAK